MKKKMYKMYKCMSLNNANFGKKEMTKYNF